MDVVCKIQKLFGSLRDKFTPYIFRMRKNMQTCQTVKKILFRRNLQNLDLKNDIKTKIKIGITRQEGREEKKGKACMMATQDLADRPETGRDNKIKQ